MKQRLEYIDALRGLAILLVVFMHVPQYGFGQSIGGYYMEMAILLAVPLFFFISGLFVPLEITPPISIKKIGKRLHSILLPTFLIGGLYAILNHISIMDMLQDKFKAGYWFTITLFEFFLIVDMIRLMACKKQRLFNILLIGACFVCYGLSMPTVQRMYGDMVIAHILGVAQWKYFIFFVLGMFVKHNTETIHSDKGGAAIVIAFLIVYAANAIGDFQLNGLLYNINLLLKEISIVLLAYYVFYTYRTTFSSQTRVGRCLSKIGTYTLEIYLMHYFVLPRNLNFLVNYSDLERNPLIAFLFLWVVTLGVVAVVYAVKVVLQCNVCIRRLMWNK